MIRVHTEYKTVDFARADAWQIHDDGRLSIHDHGDYVAMFDARRWQWVERLKPQEGDE